MKILTASEMRSADEAAINSLGIPSRVLMENAGREAAAALLRVLPEVRSQRAVVLCGTGNNAGDGYVVARVLYQCGVETEVLALAPAPELKEDARANAVAWERLGGRTTVLSEASVDSLEVRSALGSAALVVDALYGSGFRGVLAGAASRLVAQLNVLRALHGFLVAALDVPSGVSADGTIAPEPAVSADLTLALGCLKLAHVLYPAADHCGEVVVLDIGIPQALAQISEVQRELLTCRYVCELMATYYRPCPTAHKGSRGHVLVVGGRPGMLGAPKLAGSAAAAAGAGLVTLVLPSGAAALVGPTLGEMMCRALPESPAGMVGDDVAGSFAGAPPRQTITSLLADKRAVVLGPGMGTAAGAADVLSLFLEEAGSRPVVIDADALNLLALHPELHSRLPAETILTPHPGELARLLRTTTDDIQNDRLSAALRAAEEFKATVVLKGARTIIAGADGRCLINPTAEEALATAGSGDVLSGIIGALIARGISGVSAAGVGAFVHGSAGTRAALRKGGPTGVLAGDIVRETALIMNDLMGKTPPSDCPSPGAPINISEATDAAGYEPGD